MVDCPVCHEVRGLERKVDATVAAIARASELVQADSDNRAHRAELHTAIEKYLLAVETITQFVEDNRATLSQHGTPQHKTTVRHLR